MFKSIRTIINILVILAVLCVLMFFIYIATIADSIGYTIFFIVLSLLCCRIVYVLIKDVAFTKREYIEVVSKVPVDENYRRSAGKKHLNSAKCVLNGKVRTMYFKSKHDYFKVSEHKEYVMRRVGNKILEVE